MTLCLGLDRESSCRLVLVLAGAVSCALLPYLYLELSEISARLRHTPRLGSLEHITPVSRLVTTPICPSLGPCLCYFRCSHCSSLIVTGTEAAASLLPADAYSMMADTAVQTSHASAAAAPMNAVEPIPAKRPTTPENTAAQKNTGMAPAETSDPSGATDGETEFGDDFFQDWFRHETPDIFSGLLGDVGDEVVRTVVQTPAGNVRRRAFRERLEASLNGPHARQDRLLGRGLIGMFQRAHGKQGISSMLSCLTFKGTKKPVTTV